MKQTVNKKLTIKQLEERTNILLKQIVVLQEMVDLVGDNFIKYIRFKDDEKGFMDFIKSEKERKPKSAKAATKRKVNS